VGSTERQALRDQLLRRFLWTDGHADFSAVLRDPETLALLGPGLAEPFRHAGVTVVVGLEARGFLLGGLVAVELGVGLVLARKAGAVHPGPKVEVTSDPDWRGRRIHFQLARVLDGSDRALLVDDWVETGSQALAVKEAVEISGAGMAGVSVLVEDAGHDRGRLPGLAAVVPSSDLHGRGVSQEGR
jgi:adenine phosphoribosyltransferase